MSNDATPRMREEPSTEVTAMNARVATNELSKEKTRTRLAPTLSTMDPEMRLVASDTAARFGDAFDLPRQTRAFVDAGKTAFAATFGAFLTRAYDQVRMGAISRADLRLCGSHAGVSIGEDGPSQMGLEDLAAFRAVNGSTVLYPCDGNQTAKLVATMIVASPRPERRSPIRFWPGAPGRRSARVRPPNSSRSRPRGPTAGTGPPPGSCSSAPPSCPPAG